VEVKFKIYEVENQNSRVIISNFIFENFEIEIYGASLETIKQNAYRHMVIEDRILKLFSDEFRTEIIELKRNGFKTEPAFAKLLNLEGNSYYELLKLESYSDNVIINMIRSTN